MTSLLSLRMAKPGSIRTSSGEAITARGQDTSFLAVKEPFTAEHAETQSQSGLFSARSAALRGEKLLDSASSRLASRL